MSKTRRPPPEILRKSHPHADTDERARAKRELLDELEDAMDEGLEEPVGTDTAAEDAGDDANEKGRD